MTEGTTRKPSALDCMMHLLIFARPGQKPYLTNGNQLWSSFLVTLALRNLSYMSSAMSAMMTWKPLEKYLNQSVSFQSYAIVIFDYLETLHLNSSERPTTWYSKLEA